MLVDTATYAQINADLLQRRVTLVAVSKTKTAEQVKALYDLGHRDFGENYVQELMDKQAALPHDIRWHFIGHLQRNKVKKLIPFVYLIQSVDSLKLLKEINKHAGRAEKVIHCLLQVHIATEETKFGLDETELAELLGHLAANEKEMKWVSIKGLMGMASLTGDMARVRNEFRRLKAIFERVRTQISGFTILSMGMSGDYRIAIEEGSNLVRIGTLLFGERS
ncbi:MAG TPA: YggS family pyridoxal phosphate-dependent enzyme [Chitinophagaceae bacterium]|nr:YggS family pyridoxal phosphate-dependent enzyme [Chitinophagaceae bacterium]